ncbi:MAG: hypothetical protein OEL84_10630 [Nitrosopumilus sp.]|nr:hypothetical protein [Nitrosopumilus sp.]
MVLELDTLSVGNYLTAFPISVLDTVSLHDAVGFMARRGIGNLIVSTDDMVNPSEFLLNVTF